MRFFETELLYANLKLVCATLKLNYSALL
jgi:hypothetical protein